MTEDHRLPIINSMMEKLFYENINGKLTFYLNEDNEIISYQQTYLEEIGKLS